MKVTKKLNSKVMNVLSATTAVMALINVAHAATFQPAIDPELDSAKKDMLASDIARLANLSVTTAPTSYFAKSFGSTGTDGVLAYLNQRLHFIIPQSASLKDRLTVERPTSRLAFRDDGSAEYALSTTATADDGKAVMMAANIGLHLWEIQQAARPLVIKFKFGTGAISLEKVPSRVGIIQLGEGYSDEFPQGARMSTLVHEARHSDCTGGLSQADLAVIKKGGMPANRNCGHLHVKCPEGHELAGEYACDAEAWGAYAIESVYSATVAKTCANCTEKEKQIAAIEANDSFGRVLVAKDMAAGKLGNPDMSSAGVQN